MAKRKTTIELLAPPAPARTRAEWGVCPGCDRERRLEPGPAMAQHAAWHSGHQMMVPCPGSGDAPSVVTA